MLFNSLTFVIFALVFFTGWSMLRTGCGSHLDERSAELASQRLAKNLAVLLERIR